MTFVYTLLCQDSHAINWEKVLVCDNWEKVLGLYCRKKGSLYYNAKGDAGIVRARLLSSRLEGGKEVFVRLNEKWVAKMKEEGKGETLPGPNITARRMRAIK